MKQSSCLMMTLMVILLTMLNFASIITMVKADLPVHCLYNSTAPGVWEFQLTDQNMSGDDVAAKCDIRAPIQATRSMKVYLQMPNIAIDEKGNSGFFTLVYDQGFEVVVGGNKYWAFFNYTTAGKDSQGNDIIVSNCDQTFTGWYHEAKVKAKSWGCYRAKRLSLAQGFANVATAATPTKFTHVAAPRPNYKGMVFKNDMSLINDLNALHAKGEISWKAKPIQEWEDQPLETLVPKFGKRTEAFRLKQRREHTKFMRAKFGEQVNKKVLLELRSEDFSKTAGNLTFHHLRDIAAKGFASIPKDFDWRNVNGQDFVSPIRDQGKCGSCYSFATTAMMEARKRVFTHNKEQPVYSPENIISCSFYSQGCEGGFAYLISKWGEDFGIIAESCDPYTGTPHKCNLNQACSTRQYWTNYKYTGGYYGASTVENMQLDILKYGPLSVSMEVYNDLMNYHSGIYRHVPSSKLTAPIPNPFELTNHVVLIVGWGENEKGEQYWIVKNSWGTKFGIEGYFWIARGVDECAIESENASAIPAQP